MKIDLSKLILVILIFLLFSQSSYSAAPPGPEKEPSLQVDSYSGYPVVTNPYLQSRIVAMGQGEVQPLIGGVSPIWNLAVREGEGHLEFKKPLETEWSPIWQAKLLRDGDIVRTDSNGYVNVVLADNSWVTFGPNTVVDFSLIQESKKPLLIQLQVTAGALMTSWNKFMGKDSNYEITTPNGNIGARGTEFEVHTNGNKTITTVYEGKVELTNFYDNSTIILHVNERAIIEKEKKTEVVVFLDNEPLTIKISEPCLNTYSYSTLKGDSLTTKMFEGVKQDYFICLKKYPRPTYTFFTNKFFESQAINERNLQFIDGENNLIKGLYQVSGSTFTFTPNVPLLGEITIILKGGNEGICSKTKICLEQNLKFTVSGLEPSVEWNNDVPFELSAATPFVVMKNLLILNNDTKTKKDFTVTTLSFKTFYPYTFFAIHNISSPVPYELKKGENDLITFKISELKPKETIQINITYAALLLGVDYFSRLDVNNIEKYEPVLLEKFTKAEEGIEVDDPHIKELSRKIVGEEQNPFWKAYKIYNWITSTIAYDYEKEEVISKGTSLKTGALLTLQHRKGVCQDYTNLFLALARAAGIPSRFVTLYVFDEDKAKGHSFPEIYLPPYGWIPLDPTWGTALDIFARAEPELMILAKDDGLTKNHLLNYELGGEDIQGIKVLSSIERFGAIFEGEKGWISFYGGSPFFVDIYELLFLSQINDELSVLETYNLGIGKQFFTLAEKPQTSAVVTVQQALEAYHQGNYSRVRSEVQGVIGEQLKAASTSFSLLVQKSQETLQSPYSSDSLFFKTNLQEGKITPTTTEVLQQINQTKKELGVVEEQTQAGNYYAAFNNLVGSYVSASEMYSLLIADMVSAKIKTSIYSPENIFRFNQGSVVFFGMVLIFMVLMPIFWLWMLIHCLQKKEFKHLNKFWWFFIIFLTGPFFLLGAILYFILEYRKRKLLSKKLNKK